jgi:hypothetical protein
VPNERTLPGKRLPTDIARERPSHATRPSDGLPDLPMCERCVGFVLDSACCAMAQCRALERGQNYDESEESNGAAHECPSGAAAFDGEGRAPHVARAIATCSVDSGQASMAKMAPITSSTTPSAVRRTDRPFSEITARLIMASSISVPCLIVTRRGGGRFPKRPTLPHSARTWR